MSTSQSAIIQWYTSLPRAYRWLVIAGSISAVALLWANVIDPAREDLANRINRIESDIDAIQSGKRFVRELETEARKRQITLLGPINLPADERTVSERMTGAVVEVLERNRTDFIDLRRSQGRRMPQTIADRITGTSDRVVRLTMQLRFEAETDRLVKIIQELEAHPDINAITSISMTKAGGRRLTVGLTLESWYREEQVFG